MTQYIDYKGSTFRSVLTWTLYPLGVLLPMAWVISISDPATPGKLLPYAFLGLIGAGIAERIHPHVKKWQQSQGDIVTDIAHASLSLVLSTLLRAGLIYGFFQLITLTPDAFVLITWPSQWPMVLQLALALTLAEFGSYWRHRIFHERRLTRCHLRIPEQRILPG